MRLSRLRLAALALTSGLTLGGCAYGFGDPYGSYGSLGVGYGNYGYGNYGYGYPYGGSGYGYGYPYGGYGYGGGYPYGAYGSYGGLYGSPYWGWYDGLYYPGTGYYVYDTYRRPHVWTDTQKRYWISRRPTVTTSTKTVAVKPNWSAFNRDRTVRTNRVTVERPSRSVTVERPSRSDRAQEVRSNIEDRRSERLTTRSSRQRARAVTQDD